jgi:hypothetical protein
LLEYDANGKSDANIGALSALHLLEFKWI